MRKPLLWPTVSTLGLVCTVLMPTHGQSRDLKSAKAKTSQARNVSLSASGKSNMKTEESPNNQVDKILPLPLDQSPWLAGLLKQPNFQPTLFPEGSAAEMQAGDSTQVHPLAVSIYEGIQHAAALTQQHRLLPWSWLRDLPLKSWAESPSPKWTSAGASPDEH